MTKIAFIKRSLILIMPALLWGLQAEAASVATNAADNVAGGSITLTNSGDVTVTSIDALKLEKQVWVGGTCYASSSSHADCTSNATVTVPVNTAVKFVIYVQNASDLAFNDVRFQDVLDTTASGFTYTAESIKSDSSQNGSATPLQIYTAVIAGTGEDDTAVGAGLASVSGSTIQVGDPANDPVTLNGNKTFAIVFDAVKK